MQNVSFFMTRFICKKMEAQISWAVVIFFGCTAQIVLCLKPQRLFCHDTAYIKADKIKADKTQIQYHHIIQHILTPKISLCHHQTKFEQGDFSYMYCKDEGITSNSKDSDRTAQTDQGLNCLL